MSGDPGLSRRDDLYDYLNSRRVSQKNTRSIAVNICF